MQGSDRDRNVEQFEERLRRWGGRPPSLAPAHAASRVLSRLPQDGPATPWLRLAAVAALLVLIAVTTWVAAPSRRVAAPVTARIETEAAAVVEFWLDDETAVHFVLTQFGPEKGKTS
jgi:hypothetical protein